MEIKVWRDEEMFWCAEIPPARGIKFHDDLGTLMLQICGDKPFRVTVDD